ncbi:MAG: hypothetical protein KJO17_06535 [Acidimicrobiia bacterium]|nr:hypothetical protein [Acidimicrobiia bacterium]
MRLRKSLPAGLLDAGSAALATFGTGVYAARFFDTESGELGVYALFFAIFLVAAIVPFKLVFLPSEVRLLDLPQEQQLGGFRLTLPAGLPVAIGGGLIVLLAWIPALDADLSLVVPLAITTVITGILSPIQDHVRRVMHQAGRSWLAAATSIVQLAVAGAVITAAVVLDLDKAWIPFGSLALANTFSIGAGLVLAHRAAERAPGDPYGFRGLAVSGRWLTGFGLLPVGANFLAAAIVAVVAGEVFLGFAEASRVAARPLLVFVTGISAVLNPPSLMAGRDRDPAAGRRIARISKLVVVGSGFGFLAWMGFDWVGNPMAWLVEQAYTVEGLTAVTIIVNIFWGMLFSEEAQLIGGGREVDIFKIYVIAAVVEIAIAFTAPITEGFAVPLAILGFAVVRWYGYRWSLARLYAEQPPDAGPETIGAGTTLTPM